MINMFRHIKFNTSDYYCRYLDININNLSSNNTCNGRFLGFLEKCLDIKRLPYGLKLIDLVMENKLSCDLFVKLPNEYFYNWQNYPFLGNDGSDENNEMIKFAGYYHLTISFDFENEVDFNEFGHPYDSSLKINFVENFRITTPSEIESYEHPNGYRFYPYECYFTYWKGFVILESLEECKFIDQYLDAEKGVEIFKETIKKKDKYWKEKYSTTFERLSQYKTIITQIVLCTKNENLKQSDISSHVLKIKNSSCSDLEADLELLLSLYDDWLWKYQRNNGLHSFKKALVFLKKDIYFVFEWLCGCGYNEKELIENWSRKDVLSRSGIQLADVLDFEEIAFLSDFEKFVPLYSKDIKWLTDVELAKIYRRLEKYDCFAPWIRAFYDLHQNINRTEEIEFYQPRVLDSLLIISIRTEIILRSIHKNLSNQDNHDLKDVINKLADFMNEQKHQVVLKKISENDAWKLAELRDRPSNIFEKIDSTNICKNTWNNEQKQFFRVVMRFLAARNYFAHHCYKDNHFYSHKTELSAKVLSSCLHTILYVTHFLKINNPQENNG